MRLRRCKKVVKQISVLILVFLFISPIAVCDQAAWDCPNCGRTGNTGNFCGNCAQPAPDSKTVTAVIGAIIQFGHYEQDNNTGNGKEAIEWIVLDVNKNNQALLISRYGLDVKPYNNVRATDITWETCTLRSWLNDEFLQSAFSEKEQAAILTTSVDNSTSQGFYNWDTKGGKNTKDLIFLLSYAQANRYLGVTSSGNANTQSRVRPTAYAIAQGAWVNDSIRTADNEPTGWWWLRSPGRYQSFAAIVGCEGALGGFNIRYDTCSVRPALWLNLK